MGNTLSTLFFCMPPHVLKSSPLRLISGRELALTLCRRAHRGGRRRRTDCRAGHRQHCQRCRRHRRYAFVSIVAIRDICVVSDWSVVVVRTSIGCLRDCIFPVFLTLFSVSRFVFERLVFCKHVFQVSSRFWFCPSVFLLLSPCPCHLRRHSWALGRRRCAGARRRRHHAAAVSLPRHDAARAARRGHDSQQSSRGMVKMGQRGEGRGLETFGTEHIAQYLMNFLISCWSTCLCEHDWFLPSSFLTASFVFYLYFSLFFCPEIPPTHPPQIATIQQWVAEMVARPFLECIRAFADCMHALAFSDLSASDSSSSSSSSSSSASSSSSSSSSSSHHHHHRRLLHVLSNCIHTRTQILPEIWAVWLRTVAPRSMHTALAFEVRPLSL